MTRKKSGRRSRGRSRRHAPPKRSTALVRRPIPNLPILMPGLNGGALTADPVMSPAFIGTLKLTEAQVLALRRPVEDRELDWKPAVMNGPPIIPFLSHNGYRDRLDAAFGLGGWGMVPVGMPKEVDGAVYAPYALMVDGVPRAYAWGEQEKHKMSYGDAIEATCSNAIVRCGKALGIARELWNRQHVMELQARREGPRRAPPPAASHHAEAGAPITDPQARRLWVLIRQAGRTDEEIKAWLSEQYHHTTTREIRRSEYDAICAAVQRSGTLPDGPVAREPGSDDE